MHANRRREEPWDSRNRTENQRSGPEEYRSGQEQNRRSSPDWQERGKDYQIRQQGYHQDHYGTRPDSSYRNPDINFGDTPYRSGNRFQDRNMPHQREGISSQSPYAGDYTWPEQHDDTRLWTEHNRYKDDDYYRYRSGNRDTRQSAGNLDYEEEDRARQRGDFLSHEAGFFDRMGNKISQAWHNMTHNEDKNRPGNYSSRHRGYESGASWTQNRDRDRQNRGYREEDWY